MPQRRGGDSWALQYEPVALEATGDENQANPQR
jgi:hypothetical protein